MFLDQEQAMSYARVARAFDLVRFRIAGSSGAVERIIPFDEVDSLDTAVRVRASTGPTSDR